MSTLNLDRMRRYRRRRPARPRMVDGWYCRCGTSEKWRMGMALATAQERLDAHWRRAHPYAGPPPRIG